MTAVDRLAATLAKHVRMWVHGGDETGAGTLFRCSCLEWEFTNTRGGPEGEGEVYEHHHRHVAAVIASSADLAVIELPEPNEREDDDTAATWGEAYNDLRVGVHDEYADQVQVWVDYVPIEPWSPREAVEFASHLLAAAKAAEGVSRDGE